MKLSVEEFAIAQDRVASVNAAPTPRVPGKNVELSSWIFPNVKESAQMECRKPECENPSTRA